MVFIGKINNYMFRPKVAIFRLSQLQFCPKCHIYIYCIVDRLSGLVVRVSGYRYIGPGFDPRCYQIFWVVVGLERGPLSLVRSIEELLEWKK